MAHAKHERRHASFVGVLRHREFATLWFADVQSLLGDQLARVALAVLVYDRTGSGFATAAVYALTFAPALLGSLLLGPVADRVPSRALLVCGDLVRAGLLGVMALPGVPVWVLACLLIVAVLIGTPWKAAERALVAEILSGEDYVTGTGFRTATTQATQLIGFAVGGIAVATIGSRTALAVDALTFLVSGLVIGLGLRTRPRTQSVMPGGGLRSGWFDGLRTVLRDRHLRSLLLLSWLLGLLVVPEGLAAPYAAQLHSGSRAVGLLLAAMPAGSLVGSLVYVRWLGAERRARLVGPLTVVGGIPLLACAWTPGLAGTLILWTLTGLATAYQVQVAAEFVQSVPSEIRGQAISVASAGLLAVQGVGLLAGGVLVTYFAPSTSVAMAGAAATLFGGWLSVVRGRAVAVVTTAAAVSTTQ